MADPFDPDGGNSVLVIEQSDWIIDLGPDGGERGDSYRFGYVAKRRLRPPHS